MPTITVRNVPPRVVQSLKALAKRHNRSMEQEVRDVLEGYVADRRAVMEQIEAELATRSRCPLVTFDKAVLRAFPDVAIRPRQL